MSIRILLLALLFSPLAHSMQIHKVEGDHALVNLSGQHASEGDLLVVQSTDGKKQGVLRVQKVIGERALGRVVRGQVQEGWYAEPHLRMPAPVEAKPKAYQPPAPFVPPPPPPKEELAPADEPQDEPPPIADNEEKPRRERRDHSERMSTKADRSEPRDPDYFRYGILVGYTMDNQNVTLGVSQTSTAMAGAAVSGHFFADWNFGIVGLRPFLGVESFSAQGKNNNADCLGDVNCKTTVSYISAGSWLRLRMPRVDYSPWIGIGGNSITPMARSSNAITIDSINGLIVGLAGAGMDFRVDEKWVIPIFVEYGAWPAYNGVTTNWFAVRAGFSL